MKYQLRRAVSFLESFAACNPLPCPGFLLPPFTCGVAAALCALGISGVFFLDMLFKGPAET